MKKNRKLNDLELGIFLQNYSSWFYKIRQHCYRRKNDSETHPLIGNLDEEMSYVLSVVFYYFHRSMTACSQRELPHPPVEIYISCLSENFGNGLLIKARENRLIPPYSEKNAQKYQISAGHSYAYQG